MSYYLQQAQAFKKDFNYLIGTRQCINEKKETSLARGIVIVADDGACIEQQMQPEAMEKSLLDDTLLIRKPWVNKYRVYLIHQLSEGPTKLSYQNLTQSLDQLDIPFDVRKYEY